MNVKKATLSDLPVLQGIEKESFKYVGLAAHTWEQAILGGLCLTVGEPPVGYLLLSDLDQFPFISQLAVAKPYRGQGYGEKLLKSALDLTGGVARLMVESSNKSAISLYGKLGFFIEDSIPRKNGCCYYFMCKQTLLAKVG